MGMNFPLSFFRLGEKLGDHLVFRVEFPGAFEAIDGLRPLVADAVEAAQQEPQAPVLWTPAHLSFYQDDGETGPKVFAAISEFPPPSGQARRHCLFPLNFGNCKFSRLRRSILAKQAKPSKLTKPPIVSDVAR
jgi:hypothetical protein